MTQISNFNQLTIQRRIEGNTYLHLRSPICLGWFPKQNQLDNRSFVFKRRAKRINDTLWRKVLASRDIAHLTCQQTRQDIV
jgi:hypothetical protein